jgi:hypothetical protein
MLPVAMRRQRVRELGPVRLGTLGDDHQAVRPGAEEHQVGPFQHLGTEGAHRGNDRLDTEAGQVPAEGLGEATGLA